MNLIQRFIILLSCLCLTLPSQAVDLTAQKTAVETLVLDHSVSKPLVHTIGTFKSKESVLIRSEVPGIVTAILFKSGDFVKRGQKLVTLNTAILTAQLKLTQAQVKLSEKELSRLVQLNARQLVSASDLDKVRAQLSVNQAQYEEAQARLEQAEMKAPFDGHMGLMQVQVGDYLEAGDPLVSIENNQVMYVDFFVPENDVSGLTLGETLTVRPDSAPGSQYEACLIERDVKANDQTRHVLFRAVFKNNQNTLYTGSSAQLTIPLKSTSKAIKIPLIAVNHERQGPYVYRVIEQRAKKTPITLGDADNDMVDVQKGLNWHDELVVIGSEKIQEGSPLQTKPYQRLIL